jgi:hypothetical protein
MNSTNVKNQKFQFRNKMGIFVFNFYLHAISALEEHGHGCELVRIYA